MALTVADVLALDVFRQGEAEVVAGGGHLARPVRWVHISELPDIARLLKGGELLLTTGMGLAGDARVQRRYVRELAGAGVAGIVVEMGRTFSDPPPAMIEQANRDGIPLIALRKETRYIDVTEQVHAAIISHQYELLQKAESLGRDFTNIVLGGAGPRRIVDHLASIARNPVVLEDQAHQVVEYATHRVPIDDVLRRWGAHSRAGHDQADDDDPGCAWIAVSVRSEPWGRLHLLSVDGPIDEVDRIALDRTGVALSLALLAERDAAHLAEGARGALIAEILQGTYASPQKILDRARSLGVDLDGLPLAALIVEPRDLPDDDLHSLRAALLSQTRRAISRARCPALSAVVGDRVMALIGIAGKKDPIGVLDEIGGAIMEGSSELVVGVSGPAGPEALHRAFEEAREAARYGITIGRGSGVYRYGDLGLHQLLLRLASGPDLARFVESELGALLNHDARSSAPLLPTLRAYLDHGGSKTACAKALQIERRSIYHRLDRIRKLLRDDLEDPEVRARLTVALRGLDLLRRQSHIPRNVRANGGTD